MTLCGQKLFSLVLAGRGVRLYVTRVVSFQTYAAYE